MSKEKVSYSGLAKEQFAKEVKLMQDLGPKNYRPVWHFLEEGPTDVFAEKFQEYV